MLRIKLIKLLTKFAFIVVVLCCAVISSAQTCTGSSPTWTPVSTSQADVQACSNKAGFTDGDTINIPAGTSTWTAAVCPINVGAGTCPSPSGSPVGHSTNWIGAGSSNTHIIVNITSGFGNNAFFIGNRESDGKQFRISGIDFQYESADSSGLIVFTQSTGYSMRVDNNTAEPYPTTPGYGRFLSFSVPCVSPGCVIDHNTITDLGVIVEAITPGEALPGNTVWTQAMPFETINAVYFENNTMNYPSFATHQVDIDCDNGGFYVFRYNTIYQNAIGNHGYDSVYNSCIGQDVYQNTISPNTVSSWGIQYRGGMGVHYNNVFTTNAGGQNMGLTTYRMVYPAYDILAQNQPVCGYSNSKDQNGTDGYRCYEQTGAGSGTINGGLVAYPLYEWNNCKISSGCTVGGGSQVVYQVYSVCSGCTTDYTTADLAQNRDYYDWNGACGSSLTTGICTGLSTAKPSTCTVGVGLWATDTNTLYQCGAGNTWTAYYTPYTYPHPLDVNPGVQPTTGSQGNLKIQGNVITR